MNEAQLKALQEAIKTLIDFVNTQYQEAEEYSQIFDTNHGELK